MSAMEWVPTIAVVGTEGSGKTVLVATLAKRFGGSSPDRFFLSPLDNTTHRYVERMWTTLNKSEWPPSTPVGQMIDLKWRLLSTNGESRECCLRLIDCAGQDLRRIFADDANEAASGVPSHLQELADYLSAANIVICLVNLRDFLGEGDAERRLDNEVVLTSALRRLSLNKQRSRRLFLLFTQIDQYPGIQRQHGGWPGVVKRYLPYVHGEHVARNLVRVGAVAAVNETQVVRDPDGGVRRVPKKGFESKGLENLMDEVAKVVNEIATARDQPQAKAAPQTSQPLQPRGFESPLDSVKSTVKKLRAAYGDVPTVGASAFALLLALFAIVAWLTAPPTAKVWTLPPTTPQVAAKVIDRTLGFALGDQIELLNDSHVTLRNLTCAVQVTDGGRVAGSASLHDPIIRPNATSLHDFHGNVTGRAIANITNVFCDPPAGSWGVVYGRLSDTVWVRNDGPITVNQVSVGVRASDRSGRVVKEMWVKAQQLGPGQVASVTTRLSRSDQLIAEVQGWHD